MPNTTNAEDYFPGLHIHLLREQAEGWLKKYSEAPIRRILLCKFSSPYRGPIADDLGEKFKPFPHIYAIVFEVDAEDRVLEILKTEEVTNDKGEKEHRITEDSKRKLMEHDRQVMSMMAGARASESYEKLLIATEVNSRLPYERRYQHLIDEDFREVYKHPVTDMDSRRKDWIFRVRFRNANLSENIQTDRPSVTLVLSVEALVAEAALEIEPLYAAIREIGFSGINLDANDETWMKAALKYFDTKQKRFRLVKREYLDDLKMYALSGGQEARDFKGRLLEKIADNEGFRKNNPGSRKFAELYRHVKK